MKVKFTKINTIKLTPENHEEHILLDEFAKTGGTPNGNIYISVAGGKVDSPYDNDDIQISAVNQRR